MGYHQQDDNGKHCICHTCKDKLYQNQALCLKQMLNYQYYWYFKGLWTWSLLCYISHELSLSTNFRVLKQEMLQHAAVYVIKFRMTSTKTKYFMTCILQFQSKHPCINDLVYSYIPYMTILNSVGCNHNF